MKRLFVVCVVLFFFSHGGAMASTFKVNYVEGYRFFETALQKLDAQKFEAAKEDFVRSHELLTKVKMERPYFRNKKIKWVFSEIQKGLEAIKDYELSENEKAFVETFREHYFQLKEQNEQVKKGKDDLLKAYESLIRDQEQSKKRLEQEIVHLEKIKKELEERLSCLEAVYTLGNKKRALLLDQLQITEAKLVRLTRQNEDLKERLDRHQAFIWSLKEDGLLEHSLSITEYMKYKKQKKAQSK